MVLNLPVDRLLNLRNIENMNKVFLIGRLVRDPEIRTTSSGKKVASFSLAVNDGKSRDGQDITYYFDISAWDKLADITESYVKKGMQVAVVGSLRTRTWDAQDGSKRKATDITARELEILTSRREMEAMQSSQPSSPNSTQNQPSSPSNNTQNQDFDTDQDPGGALPDIDVDEINVQMPF